MRVNIKTERGKIVVNWKKYTLFFDRYDIPFATSLAILILSSVEIGFSRILVRRSFRQPFSARLTTSSFGSN